MDNKLIIIGAGDVGGFVAKHIKDFGQYDILGFLDDDTEKQGKEFCDLNVLGKIDFLDQLNGTICVALAIANPSAKAVILKKLKSKNGLVFPSFIHPRAWLGNDVTVGEGVIIYPGVSINYETRIEDFTTINMNSAIGHNCMLGRYSTLSPGVNLGGFTSIGQGSFVGIGASTIQGVRIGAKATVGGMTMILKNVPDQVTIVGNPSRIIRKEE